MDTLGAATFGTTLLLYRGCPLQEVKWHCHGPVGTTELVLYREVKCIVSFKRGYTVFRCCVSVNMGMQTCYQQMYI